MKFEAPQNSNYVATVVKVRTLVALANCDNLMGLPLFGLQAIVGKDTSEEDMGIIFPAEVQLSEDYCFHNNLFRHSDLNENQDSKGYLEDNRRVKAIRLRGHRSDALYMPVSSLAYTGVDISEFHEGDSFDRLGDITICQKYVVPGRSQQGNSNQSPRMSRVDSRMFPEHFTSGHFFRVEDSLDSGAFVVVTQKLHGTSVRIGHVPVSRPLTLRDRIARFFKVAVQTTEYAEVYGSRHVIKDVNNPNHNHHYGTDIWTEEGRRLEGLIPENYIVYGEIIGWANEGKPIQKNYTYDLLPGQRRLYVYRVSVVNGQGTISDLGWDALKEFCLNIGVEPVPELWRGRLSDLQQSAGLDAGTSSSRTSVLDKEFLDTKYHERGYLRAVPLAPESPCDEGVCIRFEGIIPNILKAKSPLFLQHETAMLDAEAEDLEETENAA